MTDEKDSIERKIADLYYNKYIKPQRNFERKLDIITSVLISMFIILTISCIYLLTTNWT
jgi:hypothetical protein